jgi:hypothetical protein
VLSDAQNLYKACEACQMFASYKKILAQPS